MSFYSGIEYTLHAPAPVVTADRLAAFLRAFAALDISDNHLLSARVRCGGPIDASDENGLDEEVIDPDYPGIATFDKLPCEIDEFRVPSLAAAADLVAALKPRTVYRAYIGLGSAPNDLTKRVGRAFAENESSFVPHTWGFQIGPIRPGRLDDMQDAAPVGWISLSLSGHGYFWPRTAADIARELNAEPAVQAAMSCIADHWPGDWAWVGAETG